VIIKETSEVAPCISGLQKLLLTVCMKMTASWVILSCCLVEVDRPFRDAHCLHHQGDRSRSYIVCMIRLVLFTVGYST